MSAATRHSRPLAVVILAGGTARRMGGGDKPLMILNGQPLIARTIAAVSSQDHILAINANGDLSRFLNFGLPVLPDADDTRPGPLAGVLAGLEWAASWGARALLSVPGDCPFLPLDLAARLEAAAQPDTITLAQSGGQDHPTVALWPLACRAALAQALAREERRVRDFQRAQGFCAVEWPVIGRDPFFNVNTPEDLNAALNLL